VSCTQVRLRREEGSVNDLNRWDHVRMAIPFIQIVISSTGGPPMRG